MVKPKHSARQRRRAFALANGDVSSHIAVGIIPTARRPDSWGIPLGAKVLILSAREELRLAFSRGIANRRFRGFM